jgi:hypothetical protein
VRRAATAPPRAHVLAAVWPWVGHRTAHGVSTSLGGVPSCHFSESMCARVRVCVRACVAGRLHRRLGPFRPKPDEFLGLPSLYIVGAGPAVAAQSRIHYLDPHLLELPRLTTVRSTLHTCSSTERSSHPCLTVPACPALLPRASTLFSTHPFKLP